MIGLFTKAAGIASGVGGGGSIGLAVLGAGLLAIGLIANSLLNSVRTAAAGEIRTRIEQANEVGRKKKAAVELTLSTADREFLKRRGKAETDLANRSATATKLPKGKDLCSAESRLPWPLR